MGTAAQLAVGQFGEPPFDQVHPRGAGRGGVQLTDVVNQGLAARLTRMEQWIWPEHLRFGPVGHQRSGGPDRADSRSHGWRRERGCRIGRPSAFIPARAERFVFVGTSTKIRPVQRYATGLFTDGGTINIFSAQARRQAGSWHAEAPRYRRAGAIRLNRANCLLTITGRSTYRLSHATGRYAGMSGSGRFTTIGRAVYPRKANRTCASAHPLAFQGTITLTGSITEG